MRFRYIGLLNVCVVVAFVGARPVTAGTPLTTTLVASGLDRPLYVAHAPGDYDRVFIVGQGGRIVILRDGSIVQPDFLDITARVRSASGEQGLLGLAFHPGFANNRYFYVNYTREPDGATVVSRFEVPLATPDQADDASEAVVLTFSQPQSNHNGGWISFGPDGMLYIATGDGGAGGDTGPGHTADTGNAQDITDNLLGKMLRIDVDSASPYAIPPDNPFVGTAGDDEIWALGLRNPWRNAFDAQTGDLYIADVGQSAWEEVSFQPASSSGAENYGWRCMEGNSCFVSPSGPDCVCDSATLTDPIYEYSHSDPPFPCSITGGEVYRGCAIPGLSGTYFFADYCSGQIWSFRYTGGTVTELTDRTSELDPGGGLVIGSISSFGTDAVGEMYICDLGGEVFKIVPAAGSPPTEEPGSTCADGQDNDCDGRPDCADSDCATDPTCAVPAVADVGIIILALFTVAAGTLIIRRRPAAT